MMVQRDVFCTPCRTFDVLLNLDEVVLCRHITETGVYLK